MNEGIRVGKNLDGGMTLIALGKINILLDPISTQG